MSASKIGRVPAVDRAFAVLELLAESRRGLSVSTVARRLAMPKSSIHAIMTTLENGGYLRKDPPTHKYFVGLRLKDLARGGLEETDTRERLRSFLLDLATKTGLTANMAVLEDSMAVLIDTVQLPGIVRIGNFIGQRMHLNCTALGKVLLAFVSDDEFHRILHGRPLIQHNQRTICSIAKLKTEMAKVRANGYAVDDEEEEIGARCVGAPVFDHRSKVVAAISVAGTTTQIPSEKIEVVSTFVKDAAEQISRALGYDLRIESPA